MIVDLLFFAAEEPVSANTDAMAQFLTQGISTGVFVAVITSSFQYFLGRRNSRIQERKNATDAESDVVTRYKDAAAEEREAKESAVRTIKELLSASESQVTSLKSTVATLNEAIENMGRLSDSQRDIILRLETERDRLEAEMINTKRVRDENIAKLRQAQIDILELTRSHEEAERRTRDTFGI